MKRLIGSMLLLLASVSHADHLDVIAFTLDEDCSLTTYVEIVDDFNEWGEAYGYQAEIAAPMFNEDLDTHYWLGRSPSTETFGKAYDAWTDALADEDSVPARLNARFAECGDGNDARRAYRMYP